MMRLLAKWCVSGVICNSEVSRQAFAELTGMRKSSIDMVYTGISAAAFDQATVSTKAAARALFGLPEDAFMVLCLSQLADAHGQHVLLDALVKDPMSHALLVGSAAPAEEGYAVALRAKIKSLGLMDRVHFVGNRVDVAHLMRAADALVHPAVKPEACDRGIMEGMLAGLPVIANRVGGNPEILQQMRSGILIKPNDADGLARSLQTLRADPELAERLGKEGASRARARFAPTHFVQSITDILRRHSVAGSQRGVWPVSAPSRTPRDEALR